MMYYSVHKTHQKYVVNNISKATYVQYIIVYSIYDTYWHIIAICKTKNAKAQAYKIGEYIKCL